MSLSNCCSALVKVEGEIDNNPDASTRYFVCSRCHEPCDIIPDKEVNMTESQDCYNLHCLSKNETANCICVKNHPIMLTLKDALEGKLADICVNCPDFNA